MMMSGLYIHIPFCVRRCFYCAFYLESLGSGPIAGRLEDIDSRDNPDFMDALERELEMLPEGFVPETVYIGGGTPTELSARDLDRLLQAVRARIGDRDVVEWSCEANPGTLTDEKISLLKDAGVSRVSLGVQSFQPRVLEYLGRLHSADDARDTYHRLRTAGFRSVNLDLICNIPGVTDEEFARDLDVLTELNPDHVSCYSLEYEPGTGMTSFRDKGFVEELDDEVSERQYGYLLDTLASAGYDHYELFNFCKPGHECVHHLNYWAAGEYHGCGPSAHSHVDGTRFEVVRNVKEYVTGLKQGRRVFSLEEKLEPEPKARETLMTSLRRLEGVSRKWFSEKTGFDLDELGGETLKDLHEYGLVESQGDLLRFTRKGLFVSSAVLAELI